ncbi:ArgS-related anticodon-binding protein NrtL [Streptomyces sp. NPDC050610]|uniref:ArgS-related anticodon-binding protein NrtL n=1 Tax=Streptomyces sp. NPDC050610 TaxID=3157097 RepID=UPI00342B5607
MTPAELSCAVVRAVRRAVEAGELSAPVPERVTVRTPPRPGCGEFATNVALRLAKDAGRPALDVAEVLRRRLLREPGVQCVEVAGPGFLNISLDGAAHATLVEELCTVTPSPALPLAPPDELVRRLGPDAARWSLLTAPGFDRDLLLVQRETNPLFRVRYAYARTQALLRNARDLGFCRGEGDIEADSEVLFGVLGDRERVVGRADPVRLARYLEHLADVFSRWHHQCPVLPIGDEKPSAVHRARLALAEATGAVLADGLHQLGITAPAHL